MSKTELVFILDRSGSMAEMTNDTIGGFNAMIAKQKEEEGEMLVSTVLFGNYPIVLHDRVPIEKIEPMTARDYIAGGMTALMDAIGGAIHHIGNVHKYARKEDVPDKTLFIITTDGMENASRQYGADRVREMIKHQEDVFGWEFIFVAANIDAVRTAEWIGIKRDNAANYHYDSDGIRAMYSCINDVVENARENRQIKRGWAENLDPKKNK